MCFNYNFHSTQKACTNQGGSVAVTFKANGDKHIIRHLFKWGKDVSIIVPAELKKKYKKYLKDVPEGV